MIIAVEITVIISTTELLSKGRNLSLVGKKYKQIFNFGLHDLKYLYVKAVYAYICRVLLVCGEGNQF